MKIIRLWRWGVDPRKDHNVINWDNSLLSVADQIFIVKLKFLYDFFYFFRAEYRERFEIDVKIQVVFKQILFAREILKLFIYKE